MTKFSAAFQYALVAAGLVAPHMQSKALTSSDDSRPRQSDRPNIVWFLAEDLSTHYLALYNDGKGAKAPNLEWMAENGIRFDNAYSNAPVSSAARTTLITGCYAPRFGGSLHRKFRELPMPAGLNMFPAYLRKAGYFTCNASKTDYNVELDTLAWDSIRGRLDSWRNRPDKDRPFFFQRNNVVTHESQLHFSHAYCLEKPTATDPAGVALHPSLPDTRLMRYTYATFYDRILDADNELGRLIAMLRHENELDNTIIFFFGDNGGSLPGTKGYTFDIGIHVPFVAYIPPKWRERLGVRAGETSDRLVSFMDFGPTALSLAGITTPPQMDGTPFLGAYTQAPAEIVPGYGDRFDELYAFNRTIVGPRFRYARNYQPHHTRSLFAFYRYKQLAFRQWKSMYENGELDDTRSRFFRPMPPEELYDLRNDPYELDNLAGRPEYDSILQAMRSDLHEYLCGHHDLGFVPETVILEEAMNNPDEWGKSHSRSIRRYADLAQMQLRGPAPEILDSLALALASDDPVERYWALNTITFMGREARSLETAIRPLTADNRSFVRSAATVALAHMGRHFGKDDIMAILKDSRTDAETLQVLNDAAHLIEAGYISPFAIDASDLTTECEPIQWRIDYINHLASGQNGLDVSCRRLCD